AMMLSAFASVMHASNAGRDVSRRFFSLTTASQLWRSPFGPLGTAECFRAATTFRYVGSSPCSPRQNATPSRAVRYGHSPYVSWPRPQRGSRKMLMLGDQNVSPLYCNRRSFATARLYLARASVEMALASSFRRSSLKVAAMAMAWGNTVAVPARATPC